MLSPRYHPTMAWSPALDQEERDLGPPVRARLATPADATFLWHVANDARAESFSREPIRFEAHLSWLAAVIHDPNRMLLVGETVSGARVGFVRFDHEERGVRVSIAVARDQRGLGLGGSLLRAALEFHGPNTYFAEVLPSNTASLRLFRHWGELPAEPDRRTFVLEANAHQEPTTDAESSLESPQRPLPP